MRYMLKLNEYKDKFNEFSSFLNHVEESTFIGANKNSMFSCVYFCI